MIAEMLQGLAEAMVAGGQAALGYPVTPISERRYYGPGPKLTDLEGFVMAVLGLGGFVEADLERAVYDDGVVVWARHRCGSWAREKVPDNEIRYAERRPGPVIERLLGMGCYCVLRKPMVAWGNPAGEPQPEFVARRTP